MSLVRFALLALLVAHGGVAGVVRPKQPVVHRIHTEANHASLPTGKISSEKTHEVSKQTATKQALSPHAPTISKQGKLEAHGGVTGMKHSKQSVAHQKVAEAPTVKFAGKTSSKHSLDDGAHKLGEAYASAFGKTATKQAPNPHAPTISKQGKLEAHGGVAGMKHSKQSVAHQKVAEAPTVKLFAGKTSSKDPLDDDAHKLGEADARAFGKTATKQAPSPHASASSKKGKFATHEGVAGVKHSKQLEEAPIVNFAAGKTSSKTSNASEVSSTQHKASGGTSAEKPQDQSAKPSPVQMQVRLSDNAEHMIEAAMDSDSVGGV